MDINGAFVIVGFVFGIPLAIVVFCLWMLLLVRVVTWAISKLLNSM